MPFCTVKEMSNLGNSCIETQNSGEFDRAGKTLAMFEFRLVKGIIFTENWSSQRYNFEPLAGELLLPLWTGPYSTFLGQV